MKCLSCCTYLAATNAQGIPFNFLLRRETHTSCESSNDNPSCRIPLRTKGRRSRATHGIKLDYAMLVG
eukprot:scaffold426_cov319-Pavlova_lutheri.AAC.54